MSGTRASVMIDAATRQSPLGGLQRPTTRSASSGEKAGFQKQQVSGLNKYDDTVFVRLLPGQKTSKEQKTDAARAKRQKQLVPDWEQRDQQLQLHNAHRGYAAKKNLDEMISGSDNLVAGCSECVAHEAEIAELKAKIVDYKYEIESKTKDNQFFEEELTTLGSKMAEADNKITHLSETNVNLENENEALKVQVDRMFLQLQKLQEQKGVDQVVENPVEMGVVLGSSVEVDFIPNNVLREIHEQVKILPNMMRLIKGMEVNSFAGHPDPISLDSDQEDEEIDPNTLPGKRPFLDQIPSSPTKRREFFVKNFELVEKQLREDPLSAQTVDPKKLLVNENYVDIAEEVSQIELKGQYFISERVVKRLIKYSGKKSTIFAPLLLEAFFKTDILVYCTCDGTKKGLAADNIYKPGLPKESFLVFEAYLLKLVIDKKMTPIDKKKIKKSLTNKLNSLRLQYGFTSTDDQKAAYHQKYKRKSKRLEDLSAVTHSGENANINNNEQQRQFPEAAPNDLP